MARIRTIKPEWLEDEKLATASAPARVMSVALIVLSDDHGRGRIHTAETMTFPGDLKTAKTALDELESLGYVHRYSVRDQRYFLVRNWERHQKIANPGKSRIPEPLENLENPTKNYEDFPPDLGPRTKDLGARTGDRGPTTKPVGAGSGKRSDKYGLLEEYREAALSLWEYQEDLRRDAVPDARGLKATDDRLLRVAQRLDAGATVEDCRHVLDVYAADVRSDPGSGKWFNGETNWRPQNFDRALGRPKDVPQGKTARDRRGMTYEELELLEQQALDLEREKGIS